MTLPGPGVESHCAGASFLNAAHFPLGLVSLAEERTSRHQARSPRAARIDFRQAGPVPLSHTQPMRQIGAALGLA